MAQSKKGEYGWCEHYGGPRDGYWCSTGDLSAPHQSGVLTYYDPDNGTPHFYVLLRFCVPGETKEPYLFYAYAGTNRETMWSRVIIGHPGCNKNNYPDHAHD